MSETVRVGLHDLGVGRPAEGADLFRLAGEAVFVVPEVAWGGMHELQQRALGGTGPFQMVGVGDLTPVEAAQRYDWSCGMVLSQLWVEGPDFGAHVVDSIAGYVGGGGALDGLEGLLPSAALTAHRDGGHAGVLDVAAQLLREAGIDAEALGAGRGAAAVMDAASGRIAALPGEAIRTFAEQGGHEAAEALRGALGQAVDTGHGGTGGHGSDGGPSGSGGFLSVVIGALTAGIGLAVSAVCPPLGEALVVGGASLVINGLKGSDEHRPGVRAIEVSHERVHEIERRPDGTTIERTREIERTKFIMTEGRPKEGGGHGHHDGDKLWDDNGGGYDPATGQPIPIDPAAVLWCPPADDLGGIIVGPRRNELGLIEGYGPYEALEAIVEAPAPPAGVLDLEELFADWTLTPDGSLVGPADFLVEGLEDGLQLEDGAMTLAETTAGQQTPTVTAPSGESRGATLDVPATPLDAVRQAFPTPGDQADAVRAYQQYVRSLS